MSLLSLIYVFIKAGILGFGGGMAVISLIQGEAISRGWVSEAEFVDIVAISQVTPGPIGINCATYLGYSVAGFWGSLVATLAIVFPSLVIMLAISLIYEHIRDRYQDNRAFRVTMRIIRILVVILIAHAAYVLITPTTFIDYRSWVIFAVVFVAMLLPDVVARRSKFVTVFSHPILLILLAGLAGLMFYHV